VVRSENFTLTTPEFRNLVVTHVHDLVALAIGATGESAEIARGAAP